MTPKGGWSIRAVLFGMIALATVPPIAIGLLQIRSAGSAGRALLAAQLDRELDRITSAVQTRWEYRQGSLLLLADNDVARAAFADPAPPPQADLAFLRDLLARSEGVSRAVFADRAGVVRWSLTSDGAGDLTEPGDRARSGTVSVIVPVSGSTGAQLGELRAAVSLASILPAGAVRSATSPPVLSVFDADGRSPLATPTFPPDLLRTDVFEFGGQRWLTRRRVIAAPALSLVLAAPLDPFVIPFQRGASQRTVALVLGSALALALAAIVASRLGRSVRRLALAAEQVAGGKLDAHIVANGTAEVGRLAAAFNAMTATLEETLRRLAQRESLAAVGEFAASLAHEIRNPLTAIRVDLQAISKRAKLESGEREALDRSLRQVQRLDDAVTGALDIARGGNVRLERTALEPILRDAIAAAEPEVAKHGARLERPPTDGGDRYVEADAGALHQVLLNLLLNASQAVDTGGVVRVRVEPRERDTLVHVSDDGRGIAAGDLARVFDPFYSTRPEGTGLGLAVARQIAIAHGGTIDVASSEGNGTTVTLALRRG